MKTAEQRLRDFYASQARRAEAKLAHKRRQREEQKTIHVRVPLDVFARVARIAEREEKFVGSVVTGLVRAQLRAVTGAVVAAGGCDIDVLAAAFVDECRAREMEPDELGRELWAVAVGAAVKPNSGKRGGNEQ